MCASSTNFMVDYLRQQKTRHEAGFMHPTVGSDRVQPPEGAAPYILVCLLGFDGHEGVAFGALLRELHAAILEREQRVVRADADVRAGAHLRAALADEDVAREDSFAAELLHAQALAVRFAAVASAAACLFMCHVRKP